MTEAGERPSQRGPVASNGRSGSATTASRGQDGPDHVTGGNDRMLLSGDDPLGVAATTAMRAGDLEELERLLAAHPELHGPPRR